MSNLTQDALYSMEGLHKLDALFLDDVGKHSDKLLEDTINARKTGIGSTDTLLELSYVLEKFIARIFNIENEVAAFSATHEEFLSIYKCKRNFVQRHAIRKYPHPEELDIDGITAALKQFMDLPIKEFCFAKQVNEWMEEKEQHEHMLDAAAKYAAYMVHKNTKSVLFQVPGKYDVENLVPVEEQQNNDICVKSKVDSSIEERVGFNIAKHPPLNYALNETHYCIVCHKQNRDSCSKGMLDKSGNFKESPMGVLMTGCPLKVKISEINLLRSQGLIIAPLAIVVIDNPMCALTGHRICNDCTRACIYQKQQQVDVPAIESNVLDCVLNLSYGFEIYSLFTRWNPLSFENVLPRTPTGKNVLVVGLGPAGISLSHYLLNEGHNVVAVDGLKIDPLPEHLSGVNRCGKSRHFKLIQDAKSEIFEHLDHRTSYGFGGVAEYGITARWNKNYLKIARLLLERRNNFSMYGGIMLGSTLDTDEAFSLGFHHISLATGAGAPRIPMVKNVLVKGMLTASSFLMSLHLGNAAHENSITNLQIRFPAVVIGGGLTAVDAATELLAYYPVQVEKFLLRYEEVVEKYGKSFVESKWDAEESEIFSEFLLHAQQIRDEKNLAIAENRPPNILRLLRQWNGVTIVYRGSFNSSTAYRINSEELAYAMSEGIYFAENLQLREVVVDQYNHVAGIKVGSSDNVEKFIEAKSVVIAIGTHENTNLRESMFNFDAPVAKEDDSKDLSQSDFALPLKDNITVFGDLDPRYRGSVVKAIASTKIGYPAISKQLAKHEKCADSIEFLETVHTLFSSRVVSVTQIAEQIVEITILSPLAASKFQPGQFFRLQNFRECDQQFNMECVAVTGASVNKQDGTVTVVVLDVGGSSRLCSTLKSGQLVDLMGPTGSPTHIPVGENVMLIGGGVGNAVLFSIGEAMMSKNCNVLYFAGYKSQGSIFGTPYVEKSSNIAVFCCETGHIEPCRKDDMFHQGNIISAIREYGNSTERLIQLSSIDRVVMVGSSNMMSAVSKSISTDLQHLFKRDLTVIASINSPMQCMMKKVCGQCIQKHKDPVSGKESFVYSCVNQDQCSNAVDFDFLNNRLKQNSVLEKCTSLWINQRI